MRKNVVSLKLLRSCRSDERGIALVMALLMVLAVSILTSGLVVVSNSEALSSLSYTTMTQVRYGAESGIHAAANHLLHSYTPPSTASSTDPLSAYDITKSPVRLKSSGEEVVLSSDPAVSSTYPTSAVVSAFLTAAKGTLNVNSAPVQYHARATLVSMRVLKDFATGQDVTLQRWEIVGNGRVSGAGAALVEVSTVIERQAVPVFSYAAFAQDDKCEALSFGGGATTKSYDSRDSDPLSGVLLKDGNVGTNGGLVTNGSNTMINGTLSTPRTGVGKCTEGDVTAGTEEDLKHTQGRVALPQPITFPTPAAITPLPPTTADDLKKGCPAGVPVCTESGSTMTIGPGPSGSTVQMGNVLVQNELHLKAGTYEINSITLNGNGKIIVDSGPVIIKVAGEGMDSSTPIDLTGNGVSNPSLKPGDLQFFYGGTGDIKIAGGNEIAALVYAPNSAATLTGGSNFYGSIITNKIKDTGGVTLLYDRALRDRSDTAGNPTMTTFSWRTF